MKCCVQPAYVHFQWKYLMTLIGIVSPNTGFKRTLRSTKPVGLALKTRSRIRPAIECFLNDFHNAFRRFVELQLQLTSWALAFSAIASNCGFIIFSCIPQTTPIPIPYHGSARVFDAFCIFDWYYCPDRTGIRGDEKLP